MLSMLLIKRLIMVEKKNISSNTESMDQRHTRSVPFVSHFCTLSPLKSRQDEDQARSEIKNDRLFQFKTFKVVFQWNQQLFTVHAFVAGMLLPAVHCLCLSKDICTYSKQCGTHQGQS
ncbi:hypothetical protein T05_8929 [Trichinella murrelli]|uniref:Uncharacterized protein n=1 Tax=Trichinella murrelli TaxID=144512 RepID=A0A0V0U4C8_9BILA|nr:hypothetical protein T05_8929 [Trichinella murrelli]